MTKTAMAYHEAGHAVAARVQGIECPKMVMLSPSEGLAAGTLTVKATFLAIDADADQATLLAAIRKDIIVSLAGPCAEMKYRNKPWDKKYFRRWTSDFKSAQTGGRRAALIATGVDVDQTAEIHHPTAEQIAITDEVPLECMATASDLVEAHWPAIERVAKALMKWDVLHQAELDRLIAEDTVSHRSTLGWRPHDHT